jgi:hypothetical protein
MGLILCIFINELNELNEFQLAVIVQMFVMTSCFEKSET